MRPTRIRASTTIAPRPGSSTLTGLRSSSRSSGTTSTSAETRVMSGGERRPDRPAACRGSRRAAAPRAGGASISRASTSLTGGRRKATSRSELDEHAAEAADEQRTEGRIRRDADERLDSAAHLALQEDRLERRPDRAQALAQRRHRRGDRGRRLEAEDHAADVALVEEARRDRLGDQRVAQALGRCRGVGGRDLLAVRRTRCRPRAAPSRGRRARASAARRRRRARDRSRRGSRSPRSGRARSTVPRGRRRQRP